jgi:hypothetical protein
LVEHVRRRDPNGWGADLPRNCVLHNFLTGFVVGVGSLLTAIAAAADPVPAELAGTTWRWVALRLICRGLRRRRARSLHTGLQCRRADQAARGLQPWRGWSCLPQAQHDPHRGDGADARDVPERLAR